MVKLYSTLTCPNCHSIEEMFKKANIEYEKIQDIDIMASLGIMGVPQVDPGDGKLLKSFYEITTWMKTLNK